MISIIIPTLNESKIIEKTLNFLKDLPKNEFEIIIADGGSSDNTVEIAKKYTNKIVVLNGKHTIAYARNEGAKIAQGDIFLFLDADVFVLDTLNILNKLKFCFENDSKLVGLSPYLVVLPQNATFGDNFFHFLINFIQWFGSNILNLGIASGEFQMIKKDAFWAVGGYNKNLVVAEDNDLFLKLSKIGKVKKIWNVKVYHTGRRAHQIGWPKLLFKWLINFFSVIIFKKSISKKWEEIR